MDKIYKKQVSLLLNVLPEVAKEKDFALHGGTAINLFVRDMPRLSVDIDLTYLPIEERSTSLTNIAEALSRIQMNLEKIIPGVSITPRLDDGKLLISAGNVSIKLEVNLINRGALSEPTDLILCEKAQTLFDAFCSVPVVPTGQLFGGKIVAALDRQHPRDLFDVKYIFQEEGFTDEIKKGFLLFLICSERPIHEIIHPNFKEQRSAFTNQFSGMTAEAFTYEEYESVREQLVKTIHDRLTTEEKKFLLNIHDVTPDWSVYDFSRFPSVNWKLQNLQQLKSVNPDKHKIQFENLSVLLGG